MQTKKFAPFNELISNDLLLLFFFVFFLAGGGGRGGGGGGGGAVYALFVLFPFWNICPPPRPLKKRGVGG